MGLDGGKALWWTAQPLGGERHDREKHRTEVTEVTEGDLGLDGGRFGKHHGVQQLTPIRKTANGRSPLFSTYSVTPELLQLLNFFLCGLRDLCAMLSPCASFSHAVLHVASTSFAQIENSVAKGRRRNDNFDYMVALKAGYDLAAEVLHLKRDRNAIILAHNYQVPEIQDLADFVGDSLGLSYKAKDTDADVIVFCGVHFMAETAKIINPGKTVILPDLDAGCSLSESCPAESLEKFLQQHADKNYYVIAYINCSAGVKALSDIICTSGNAVKVVENAPADRNILFVPDQNLGSWVMEKTGRKMDLWRGACYVHVEFTKNSIGAIREQYPAAPVVAHPECTFAVRMLADEVCSTEKMVNYCRDSEAEAFIIVTESGMLHRLKKEIPGKTFIPGPTDRCACADCRFMKKNTLEKLRDALANLAPEILLPEPIRRRAELPIIRMLDLSR